VGIHLPFNDPTKKIPDPSAYRHPRVLEPPAVVAKPATVRRQPRGRHGLDWPVVAWIVIVHAGGLAAPFVFTWKAVGVAAFLGLADTGSIGVCMGYHRQLTHGSLFARTGRMRLLFALIWRGYPAKVRL